MSSGTDAILLTPPGAGAIGVIRIRGPSATELVRRLFEPKSGAWADLDGKARLRFGRLVDGGEVIDDVLVGPVPSSPVPAYDISMHGGVRILERALQAFESLGARLRDAADSMATVWPAAHRIDEDAVDALSRAKTRRAVAFILRQRQRLPSHVESIAIQFASNALGALEALRALIERAPAGIGLVDGFTVAIVGPPNSGKSTLLNRLVGREAVVVSPVAGTTRDWVREAVEIEGVPVDFVDTAGLHASPDALEQLAVSRGIQIGRGADLVLLLWDGSEPVGPTAMNEIKPYLDRKQCLMVLNKADLRIDPRTAQAAAQLASPSSVLTISAREGVRLEALRKAVLENFHICNFPEDQPGIFCPRQARVGSDILAWAHKDPGGAAAALRGQLIGRPVESGRSAGIE